MKLLTLVKNLKNSLIKATRFIERELPEAVKINMSNAKLDEDSEAPPSKKLCSDENNKVEVMAKIRKKKVAILLGYLGDNYYGMQINPSVRTVEGELLSALIKNKYIHPESVAEPNIIRFQRCARTDKGVSAVKQLVNLFIAENYCIETINKNLPEDIRIFSATKVTKGFNSKTDCTGRTYSYTLPTFAFAPELHMDYPKNYRINEEIRQKISEILQSYVGTVNFHNFTTKKHFSDPSSKRYIMYCKAEEPFLENDEEFITVKIKGQSFMFHQIRKMVGHVIAIMKGIAPQNIQTDIWTSKQYSVPLAPSLGLLLEDVHFDRYNNKWGNDGIHEALNWSNVKDEVQNFRKSILSEIIKKEVERKSMYNWILDLNLHSYEKLNKMIQKLPDNNEEDILDKEQRIYKKT